MNDLFLQSVTLSRNEAFDTSYLKEIEALRSLKTLSFSRRITFFAGENGTGKSTLLEAIAIASGLNPEGGTKNYSFSTYDDYSGLAGSLRLSKGPIRPRQSYFLRAESFYNVASSIDQMDREPEILFLSAKKYGKASIKGDLLTDEKVIQAITAFVNTAS